jgi:MSHA pilin protein MshB
MKKQQGFTLIELIAVVVILGFLAATAVPKFMDATDDAKEASIEGVAGGISSAVSLVRSQWELDGRTLTASIGSAQANAASVVMDNTTIWVNSSGYPFYTGTGTPSSTTINAASCELVFDNILQNSPTSTTVVTGVYNRYFVSAATLNGFPACVYHLIRSLDYKSGDLGSPDVTTGQGFYYTPDSGQVTVFGI